MAGVAFAKTARPGMTSSNTNARFCRSLLEFEEFNRKIKPLLRN